MIPFFALVISISFLLFILIRTKTQKNRGENVKILFSFYALVICGILCGQVYFYIGFNKYETPRLPRHLQRGIVHFGYYVKPESEFVFTARGQNSSFGIGPLSLEEKIILKPVYVNRRASNWNVRYNALAYPLRVNGRCVNIPGNGWYTDPGDTFYIYFEKQKRNHFVSFRYLNNSYYLSCGIRNHTGSLNYVIQNAPISNIRLREGIKIYDLLMIATNKDIKNILKSYPCELKEILKKVLFVREIKGKTSSSIGILPAGSLLTNTEFSFHMNDNPLKPIEGEEKIVVSSLDSISYGFGNLVFSVRLSRHLSQSKHLGNVLECYFESPLTYPLPPDPHKPFIITNDNSHILLDGYYFDMGNPQHPFYAKASFSEDLNALYLNDGKQRNDYRIGEIIHFGDRRMGALLSFQGRRTAVTYTGIKAVGILILLTTLFIILTTKQPISRLTIGLNWTIIWGITLALMVFRLIETYRVSLLPPIDASPKEIEIFHKSLTISFWGFIFIPLALLLIRFISQKRILDWFEDISSSDIFVYSLFLLLPGMVIAARLFGDKETLFNSNFRTNIGIHIIIIAVLVLTAPSLIDSYRKRVLFCLSLICTFLFMIFLIKDAGFIVNGISLGLTVVILIHWNFCERRKHLVPLTLVTAVFFLLLWGLPGFSQRLAQLVPQEKHWHYRMIEDQDSMEKLLLDDSKKNTVNMRMLLRNAHQRWQMLLYAAEGARQPKGFGKAPLSARGMTYATALTDCFYSYFVLSEYGHGTGALLIILFFSLGFMIVYAAGFLPEVHRYRLLPLTAIGLFFVVNALYIASANIGILPFSGINMPLFGLYSRSDLVQGGFLLFLAVWLISDSIYGESVKFSGNQTVVRYILIFILVGIFTWIGIHYYHQEELTRKKSYTHDFNFSPHFYNSIEKNLSSTRNNSIFFNPGSRRIEYKRFGGFLSEIEELFIDKFNKLDNKFTKRSLYYLEKDLKVKKKNRKFRLRVNRHYFVLPSPFKKQLMWRGVIFGDSPIKGPSVIALGKQFTVTLSDKGHAQSIALNWAPPSTCNRMILITENHLRNSHIICELLRDKHQLFLIPRSRHWVTFVEGEKIEEKIELHPHNIIVFQKRNGKKFNWIYLGSRKPVLAYVRWRNGKERRIFPYGPLFAVPYTLAKAFDSEKAKGKKLPGKLELSVDISLHQTIKTIIKDFAFGEPFYRLNDPIKTPKLAVTVMDAFSGEIKAIPSYPEANPNSDDFEKKLLHASPQEQVRLLTNFNLLNHENGSTFKPHILSAVSTALWPEINIGEVIIHNQCMNETNPEQRCLHSDIGGIPILPWDSLSFLSTFDTKNFLTLSEDYGILVGWLGLVLKKKDIWRVLIPDETQPDFEYRSRDFTFDLTQLEPQSSPFSLKDVFPRITSSIEGSLLFKSLKQLFDFHISEDYDKALRCSVEGFLPSLKDFDFKNNIYINNVVPEPVIFNPRYYQYNRGDLISFFLGGGPNRINNIAMAQSAARMATGKRAAATLEKRYSMPVSTEPLPNPIGLREWRNENLVIPLEGVGKIGTAKVLSDLVEPPLKVIYKTGTIIKTENSGLESETLSFVIGQWKEDHFVEGRTLAGFLYMEESKERKAPQKKFQLAKPIIVAVAEYLKEKIRRKP